MPCFTGYKYGSLWLAILLVLAAIAVNGFTDYGVVTPLDPFIFVGEPLRLYCNITNPAVREDSSSLYFEKGDEIRASQILNTRVIRLTVPEAHLSDDGSYVCFLRTLEDTVDIVGHQKVKVDIAPREVVSVDCRVYNWETMTCTWDLGVRYNHPKHVNVSVVWVATDVQQDCPQLTTTSCHWDRQHYSHGLRYNILIEVTYKFKGHIKGEARKMIKINSEELVEPAPVENLRAMAKNSSCIVLAWHIPRVFMRAKRFIQQIRPPGGNWSDIRVGPSARTYEHNSSHESVVCDLDPNTAYDFRVGVLPALVDDGRQLGFRSQWRSVFARTEEDVPSAAPMTCPGCYFDLVNSLQDSATTNRSVRVMWKEIPEASRHGKLTHYTVSYVGIDSNYNGSIVCHVRDTEYPMTSAVLELPSRQEGYRVRVVGATIKGESLQGSYISIPSLEKQPQPPQRFLVKRNKDVQGSERLFLSWAGRGHYRSIRRSALRPVRSDEGSAAMRQSVKDLYVVWCRGSRIAWQCEDEPEWISLPPDQVTYELVTGLTQVDPYDLLIGISVQVRVGGSVLSSGIHWSTCVYTRNQNNRTFPFLSLKEPETAPLNVRFSPTSTDDDSLVVVWEKRGCREETSYITEYIVRYCPSSTNNILLQAEAKGAHSQWVARPSHAAGMLDGLTVRMLRKCHPVNHYRGRPLPEPPANDVLVDHHTYGTSSGIAFMNNLGSDEKNTSLESADPSQDCTNSNIPLMAGHAAYEDHIDSYIQQKQTQSEEDPLALPEKTDLSRKIGGWLKPVDSDSAISTSGYIKRPSAHSPTYNPHINHTIGLNGPIGCLGSEVPVAFSFINHRPACSNCPELEAKDFSTTDTLPARSHWPVFPENIYPPRHASHNQLLGQRTFGPISGSPSIQDSVENCALSHAIMAGPAYFEKANLPDKLNNTEHHPASQVFSAGAGGSGCVEEFCTCDSDLEDACSVDLNDNVSPRDPSAIGYPPGVVERRHSIPIETIFSSIPPPPGPPSPTPPYDNAPPLPTDCESRFPLNHSRERFVVQSGLGSQEYLEPQVVPSGYVSSVIY
ncbi:cytokine receptor [Elysia marginata]|uniref:Cytokine receptor n=1 Tax=Elysia marginata TaxID=1093978 RepID=A0AAV4GR50_9GAST|nr:cytokine receptor [Elysia marginata]